MAEQLRKAVVLKYESHYEQLRLNLTSLCEFIANHGLSRRSADEMDDRTLRHLSAYLTAATKECDAVEVLRDVALHAHAERDDS